MNSRLLIYWTTSILTLILCLFFPHKQSSDAQVDPVLISSLLKVEPGFIAYFDNKFHATVAGQLMMDIKQESLKNNLSDYDVLVVDGLEMDHNTQLSLHWQVGDETFSKVLNHSNKSITTIDFKTNNDNIEGLHLLFQSNYELHTQPSLTKTVSFNSIYLDQLSNHNIWGRQFAQWFAFKPLEINSVNGYSNSDNFLLKELVYRVMIWLSLNLLVYFLVQINGKHFIITIAWAWLMISLPFVSNFIKQHQQISEAFPNSNQYINALDARVSQLAQDIQSELNNLPITKNKGIKYIILGPNKFEYLRLFYHLTENDIGISFRLEGLGDKSPQRMIYILTHDYLQACSNLNHELWANHQISLISKKPEYCLAEVL